MHVNFPQERKGLVDPASEGMGFWRWGRSVWEVMLSGGWGAGELIDPQLQVAELQNTAKHSETCSDYQANSTYGGSARSSSNSDIRCTDLRDSTLNSSL